MRKNTFLVILIYLFSVSLIAATCTREEGSCTVYEHGVCGEYDFGAPVTFTGEEMTLEECRDFQDNIEQSNAQYPDCNVTYDWEPY